MRYCIDLDSQTIHCQKDEEEKIYPLFSAEAFEHLSNLWLKIGWNLRYHYTFSWMGRPILQLPEDLIRLQEVIFAIKPSIIIETGVAMGGSMLFYATLLKTLGHGKVIGVEIDFHSNHREALENHPLSQWIQVVSGNSIAQETFEKVRNEISPEDKVLVILDSNHSKDHVLQELEVYAPLVTPDSFLIVADGFKEQLSCVPRGKPFWAWDHPSAAVQEFLKEHSEFVLDVPERFFNRSKIRQNVTHFQNGWLRKISAAPV